MLLMASMVFSSIFQLLFDDLTVLLLMVCNGRFQEGLRFVAPCPVPVSFFVLVDPRRIPAALGVNTSAELLVSSVQRITSYVNSRFFRVYFVRNAVAQVTGIDRSQLLGVSLRHKAALFQGLFHGGMKGAENGAGVVLEIYGHRCNPLSPRLVFCHCAKVMSGIMPSRSRRKASSCGMPLTSAISVHRQLYTR